jgi:peptidyl-Asp metalloendopeptidase
MLRPATAGMRPPAPLQAKRGQQKTAPAQMGKALPARTRSPMHARAVVIDVLVAYSKKTASNYADVKRELIDLSIEEGNESFRMSNLGNIKLRLVHAYQTDYEEDKDGEHFDHLYRMVDKGDGYMEEVHALRDKYRADVVVLIVDDPSGCGLATRVFADAADAFAVVHHECAASSYSLAHEIGHLIGARHDTSIDKNMTPFAYGHGYVNGTKWRDIMSYKASCGGCPRLPVWSSPTVLIKGEPAGTPDLDNARVISEQAARVGAFR